MNKRIFLTALLIAGAFTLFAQKTEVFTPSNQAINGYDPVAYFTSGKPVKGDQHFTYQWKDANWLFSNKENLNAFKQNPEQYAPQYGGYCAYGMSEGHKAPTDPNAWTIVNGKLYLNYNLKVKEMWTKEQGQRIEKANMNWPQMKNKE